MSDDIEHYQHEILKTLIARDLEKYEGKNLQRRCAELLEILGMNNNSNCKQLRSYIKNEKEFPTIKIKSEKDLISKIGINLSLFDKLLDVFAIGLSKKLSYLEIFKSIIKYLKINFRIIDTISIGILGRIFYVLFLLFLGTAPVDYTDILSSSLLLATYDKIANSLYKIYNRNYKYNETQIVKDVVEIYENIVDLLIDEKSKLFFKDILENCIKNDEGFSKNLDFEKDPTKITAIKYKDNKISASFKDLKNEMYYYWILDGNPIILYDSKKFFALIESGKYVSKIKTIEDNFKNLYIVNESRKIDKVNTDDPQEIYKALFQIYNYFKNLEPKSEEEVKEVKEAVKSFFDRDYYIISNIIKNKSS